MELTWEASSGTPDTPRRDPDQGVSPIAQDDKRP